MALSTQPYKGTRDFYPEDMRLRNYIFDKWRAVCEQFGYEEYDGPILEPLELFTAKTSEEIVNEQSYSFTDRGERKVIMRPEMTPTVSRMVAARRQELGYPLRLYSIPNCFRYERPQKGRLREFWQLNADLFGVEGIEADVEMIQLADAIMKSFGAKSGSYEIRLSSRAYLESEFDRLNLSKEQRTFVISLIDKFKKIKAEDWEKLFREKLEEQKVSSLLKFLNSGEVPSNVAQLIEKLKKLGVEDVAYDKYIARGFDYYTDIVFEVFDTNPENNRSMFGGGRYDGLVGMFGVEPVPTVGFGMGDVTLVNFLETNGLLPKLVPSTDVTMILIGSVFEQASKLAADLRSQGLNVSIDATDRKLDRKIKTADKQGIRYALFVGETELQEGSYSLKDLVTGTDQKLTIDKLVEAVRNR